MPCMKHPKTGGGVAPSFPEVSLASLCIVHLLQTSSGWRTKDVTPKVPSPYHEQKGWSIPDGLSLPELKRWAENTLPPRMVVVCLYRSPVGDVVDGHLFKVPLGAHCPPRPAYKLRSVK